MAPRGAGRRPAARRAARARAACPAASRAAARGRRAGRCCSRRRLGDGRARPRGGRARRRGSARDAARRRPDDGAEPHLGARARVRDADGLPGDAMVLLEPTTEGRLAASLARDGEGRARCTCGPPPASRPGSPTRATAACRRARGGRARSARRSCVPRPGRRRPARHRRRAAVARVAGRAPGTIARMNDVAQHHAPRRPDRRRGAPRDPAHRRGLSGRPERPRGADRALLDAGRPGARRRGAAARSSGSSPSTLVPRFETDERFIRIVAVVVDPLERERGIAHACSPRSSGSRARRAPRSSRSPPATTGPRPASCSSRWATTPSVTAYLRKRP